MRNAIKQLAYRRQSKSLLPSWLFASQLLLATTLVAQIAAPIPSASSTVKVVFDRGGKATVIPVEVSANRLYMKVQVNGGEPGSFVVDTGAAVSVISKTWAKSLNLNMNGRVVATGSGGSVAGGFVKNVTFGLPHVSIAVQKVAVLDLSEVRSSLDRDVDGILGYDVLSRFVARIDYEAKEITLFDPVSFQYWGRGTEVPLSFVGNTAQIPVRIVLPGRAPIDTTANLDTGASGLQLTTQFVDSHDVLSVVGTTIAKPTVGIGGETEALQGRIGGIQVGTYILHQPVVTFMRSSQGVLSKPQFGANIGGQILAQFVSIFDYEHKKLFLEPKGNAVH